MIDSAKVKVSELGRKYENVVQSGIDIEIAKQILREEDQFDKQRFREKIKERHKEEKRKQKAARREEANIEEADSEENADDGSESEGPDLSWLPDPDKIYGKQQNTDDEASSGNQSEDEESEEENVTHR